jgi:hypothetical protein
MTLPLITFAALLAVSVGILLALVGLEMRREKERRARRKAAQRPPSVPRLKGLGSRSRSEQRGGRVRGKHRLPAR